MRISASTTWSRRALAFSGVMCSRLALAKKSRYRGFRRMRPSLSVRVGVLGVALSVSACRIFASLAAVRPVPR